MTQSSLLTRMRTGDVRSIPLGVWLFLALAIADGLLRFGVSGFESGPLIWLAIPIAAAPFLFAAAVAYAAPADRRFMYGAMAIAFNEVLNLLDLLFSPRIFYLSSWETASGLLGYTSWLFTLGGLLLIALALGGVRTRLGWAAVGLGAVTFLVSDVLVFDHWSKLLATRELADIGLPIEQLAISFVAPVVVVGWAYLLGAALDHRRTSFAIGASLMLGLSAVGWILGLFLVGIPATQVDYTMTSAAYAFVHLAGWVALIVGALTELGPRRQREPFEGDAAVDADAEA